MTFDVQDWEDRYFAPDIDTYPTASTGTRRASPETGWAPVVGCAAAAGLITVVWVAFLVEVAYQLGRLGGIW